MQTLPQEDYKRVQYVKVEKEDLFFSQISKKYKGRYYKNLKNGAGWSFPFEHKDKIDAERQKYLLSCSPVSHAPAECKPERLTTSIGIQTEFHKSFTSVGTDPIQVDAPIYKSKGTNTCRMLQHYHPKHNYTYNLPKGFERYYEFYSNLITNCQENK